MCCSMLQCVAVCCSVLQFLHVSKPPVATEYGVASVSRIDKIIGLFCRYEVRGM